MPNIEPFTRDEQRANLVTLGRYMTTLTKMHNVSHFRMGDFVKHFNNVAEEYGKSLDITKAKQTIKDCFCGTAACAIGHMPMAMPDVLDRAYKYAVQEEIIDEGYDKSYAWAQLSEIAFGFESRDQAWVFLFGGMWEDNSVPFNRTSWGVADRIAWLLMNGVSKLEAEYNECGSFREIAAQAFGASVEIGWLSKRQHATRVKNADNIASAMRVNNVRRAQQRMKDGVYA